MFINKSALIQFNPPQLNYGIAVSDIDGDGAFELFVAGFGGPNLVLKWNGSEFVNIADSILADVGRQAIGVAAADIDFDGREEIYILNTDTFAFRKQFADRLFDWQNNKWLDLFSLPEHQEALNLTAGRSVVCVDRTGSGRYGFFVANYGGPMQLYELNNAGKLVDVAPEVGVNVVTGGRGVISLPLVSDLMDIFTVNENSPNYLFRNRGDGTFEEIAEECGLSDPHQHGRGVTILDGDGNGLFDIVYGNWEGEHRFYSQIKPGIFKDIAPPDMARPSRIRTVIAADFDNDGYEELFFNNIGEPNRLFALQSGKWTVLDTGDAWEPDGLGTGAAVGDFDGDGQLELAIAHGESNTQPLSLYRPTATGYHWLRVLPLTASGAPARGAICTLTAGGRKQKRAIDAGSGYLCQMEPVAHFGLGESAYVELVEVRWPDGAKVKIENLKANQLIRVSHPKSKL